MSEKLDQLKAILGEISDLNHAAAVLGWDQQAYMPPAGAEARGQQLGADDVDGGSHGPLGRRETRREDQLPGGGRAQRQNGDAEQHQGRGHCGAARQSHCFPLARLDFARQRARLPGTNGG